MFSKPEEVIMAILATLWVVATYFIAGYSGASPKYMFLITGLTVVWAVASFLLWQAGRVERLYPVLIGALIACWWPWLDWFAVRNVVVPQGEVLLMTKPWYASWTFKLILALLPIVLGYVRMWRNSRKVKFNPNPIVK